MRIKTNAAEKFFKLFLKKACVVDSSAVTFAAAFRKMKHFYLLKTKSSVDKVLAGVKK